MPSLERLPQVVLLSTVILSIANCDSPPRPTPTSILIPTVIPTPTDSKPENYDSTWCVPPEFPTEWRSWGKDEQLSKELEPGKTFRVQRSGLLVTATIESSNESKIYERGYLYRYDHRILSPPGNFVDLVTYHFYACDENNIWLYIAE